MRRIMIAAGLCALLSGAALAQVTVGGGEETGGHDGHDGHQASLSTGEVALIEKRLAEYDAAFNAKDLEKLGTFYHPDVTIYEGGGVDNGWAAYREGHLGPELKGFENLQFGHRDITVSILPGGQSAYVRSEYFLKAKMGTREIDSSGLATYVLIKGENGWKIRHSHTSSRPRRPAGG
jgi:ketosteroid isomerase-like protein